MSERVINDPTVAGWELNPDTGYWMWAAGSGSGGGGSIQDGDTEGQITTWDGTEWTPEDAVVVSDGKVGIGWDSPDSALHVAEKSSGLTARFTNSSNQTFDIGTVSGAGSAGAVYLDSPNSGSMQFRIGKTERVRIDANGDVNITGKLFINGVEVTTGGGGSSFWVEESPGVIKYNGTAKATDLVGTG